MISAKILLSLSIIAVLVIACQGNLIKGEDTMEVQERNEIAMDDDDRMKTLLWSNNRRSDYEDARDYFTAKNKREVVKIVDDKSKDIKPMPVHVNPLKDYLYRADEDNKQKILYCKYDGECTTHVQCCTRKCVSVGDNRKECVGISGTLIFFK